MRAKNKTTDGERSILKIKRCRTCLVETGPHNVRHRAKLKYHICSTCEDMEDKERRERLKIHVLNHYGGKCVCCPTTIMEFLSMDHINGDGYIDRRLGDGDHIWNQIKRDNYPDTYQILCFNCHMAKTHYGYCPHSMLNNRRLRKQLLLTVFKDAPPGLPT
jgi:hypothetical protein